MPPTAFIFDMDDLLIRSGDAWTVAAKRLLLRHGQVWTPELAVHYKGMNALDVADTMRRLLRLDVPAEAFRQAYRRALIEDFPKKVEPLPGAIDLVRRIRGRSPMVVASGSPMAIIEYAMDQLDIRGCFNHLITSESVARGKPHPDVFLAAAEAMKVPPTECLVFEDSPAGIDAALAAGMACFCVPSGNPNHVQHATRVFPSLADITDADLGW
jgi:HAD superfamily hydrolase (TIGR01509 family)